MIITVNAKKTVIITTIGLCFLGSLYAAYRLYVRKKKAAVHRKTATGKSNHHKTGNGSVASGGGVGGKLDRPLSLTTGDLRLRKANVTKSSSLKSSGSQYQTPSSNNIDDEQKNLPAEELLELGLDYLTQAIKSWETALDSIENAAYMQSQVRALPNDQHADLVYKLRNLVDSANNITLNCGPKLVKSSKTLQIIQSRLAHKQHRYAEALIRNSTGNIPAALSEERLENTAARVSSPSGSLNTRYTSADEEEEDNESFVSADSDVDWLTEEMLQNIQNVDDKNVLYEMAVSNVNLGGVSYRVSRAELLKCGSEQDFAAKLHVIRLGFDRLLQDASKRQWFIDYGRNLLDKIMQKAEKDSSGLSRNYDEIIRFVTTESNWRNLKDELATRDVQCLNFYDVALDFILLDAFDDLEDPPSAISAVIQNRWLSQSFKETALATAVWSVLKAKRRLLKYPDGFISRFYSLNEYLVPVLAWGFLGTDPELNRACHFLKNQVVEYLTCLFDMNRTRYTNLEELTNDIDTHSTAYLQNVLDNL